MFDVISIGASTKDVFLISRGFKLIKTPQFKGGMGECFSYGSKVEIGDIYFDTGGGATNSAYTFSNLGLKPSIVSKIGHDIYGMEIMHILAHNGVDIHNLSTDKAHKTAYSTILVVSGGDRTVLVYRGASANFNEEDFNWSKLKTRWFYISSLAGNINLLKKIFIFAKKNKINIAWNPGADELKLGASKLKSLIKDAYVFNLNKEEAQKLTGKKDVRSILKAIDKMSAGYNIVTDGGNGAYLSDGTLIYYAKALNVPVVNTTGAGDAFGSAFCAGLILRNDWDFGLRLAILNSAGTITKMGAKNGLLEKIPSQNDLNRVKIQIIR
ncbi:MAG: carbohydrate kinase family protein [Patescibacteria group bacterium]|nr:carbohydrate kinase family protein [Patescibacteria group bacterium]